jgi:NAD(P)-dependent dehydrogenase (short-subunit alcohol dehydrogenase family)
MNNQVVLITGALTGIGRATALAFANEGAHRLLFPVGMTKKAKSWSVKSAKKVQKRSSSVPMYAARRTYAT